MQNIDNTKFSKTTILAELIYKAIVRYIKAKRSIMAGRNPNFRLDSSRIWRGNVEEIIDRLEKARD